MNKEISVGAIVFNKNKEVLLLKRSDKVDFWEFPKGHKEQDEKDIDTLKRELKEEIGIMNYIILPAEPEINEYINSKGNLRIIKLYVVITKELDINLSLEHESYKWCKVKEAKKMLPHISWVKILENGFKKAFKELQ